MSSQEQYEYYKRKVTAILKKHKPEKVKAVDALLSKYPGREHSVYVKVCTKYKVKPEPEFTAASSDVKKSKLKNIKQKKKSKESDGKKVKSKAIKSISSKPKPKPKPKPKESAVSSAVPKKRPPSARKRSVTSGKPSGIPSKSSTKLLKKKTSQAKSKAKTALPPRVAKPTAPTRPRSKPSTTRPSSRSTSRPNSASKPVQLTDQKSTVPSDEPSKIVKSQIPKEKLPTTKADKDESDDYSDDFENYSDDFDEDENEDTVPSNPPSAQVDMAKRKSAPMTTADNPCDIMQPTEIPNKSAVAAPSQPKPQPIQGTQTQTVSRMVMEAPGVEDIAEQPSKDVTDLSDLKAQSKQGELLYNDNIFSRGIQSYRLLDRAMQTDRPIITQDVGTDYQYNLSREKSDRNEPSLDYVTNYQSSNLKRFLDNSSKVMENILSFRQRRTTDIEKYLESHSNEIILESPHDLCYKRYPVDFCFSPFNPYILAAFYSRPAMENTGDSHNSAGILDKYDGMILVWDIRKINMPHKILVSPTEITCIAFDSQNEHVIYAGRRNGCLSLWDLREPQTLHTVTAINDSTQICLRFATFETESIWNGNHMSSVVTVACTRNNNKVYSIDENGVINVWKVHQVKPKKKDYSTYDFNLGLRQGGKIHLSHIAKYDFIGKHTRLTFPAFGIDLSIDPSDDSRVLVAAGAKVYQVHFSSDLQIEKVFTYHLHLHVTCVEFSRDGNGMFLAGYDDGSLCLFSTKQASPTRSWTHDKCCPVTAIAWSSSQNLFFVTFRNKVLKISNLDARDELCWKGEKHMDSTDCTNVTVRTARYDRASLHCIQGKGSAIRVVRTATN